jgi:hypothetical protein
VLYPYEFGEQALSVAQRMESLGVRIWAMNADQIRLLHHALRGETEQIRYYRERVELYAVQGNASWQAEVFWPVLLLTCDALAGDTIGVRRLSEQLSRRAREVPGLQLYAEAAHAIYLSMHGSLKEAIAGFERILPLLAPRKRVAWHTVRALYADALTRSGNPARAKQVLSELFSHQIAGEERIVVRFLEPRRQLALAEAALGNHAAAIAILDAEIARHAGQDNHLLLGLLHKARAQVAAKLEDHARVEQELALTEQHFRATKNPAAIAQWERLSDRLLRKERKQARALEPRLADERSVLTQRVQSELMAADDPCSCALSLVLARAKAKSAHLYLLRDEGLSLVAGSSPVEPPRALEEALRQELSQAATRADQPLEAIEERAPGDRTVAIRSDGGALPGAHQTFLLCFNVDGAVRPIGAVILEHSQSFHALDATFSAAIASGLSDLLLKTVTAF